MSNITQIFYNKSLNLQQEFAKKPFGLILIEFHDDVETFNELWKIR